MRENRPSGLEGGVRSIPHPYLYREKLPNCKPCELDPPYHNQQDQSKLPRRLAMR